MATTSKRLALIGATGGLLFVGFCFLASVFIRSLQPTEPTILSHIMEVDLSGLVPGGTLRFKWERREVFVLRRTPEQISWLGAYTPPTPEPNFVFDPPSPQVVNRFRSLQPEYFVTTLWNYGKLVMLPESKFMWNVCEDFRYSPNFIQVSEKIAFPGAFYCASMYGNATNDFSHNMFVYDVAGRPSASWVAPLEIPSYSIKQGSVLVLGPPNPR